MGQRLKPPLLRLAVTSAVGSHAKEKCGLCRWVCGCNDQQQYEQLITKL